MSAEIESITIGPGSKVTMHYSLSLPDGTVVDSSEDGEAIQFTMGDGTFIEGLEMVLYGLKAGEHQCLSIEPRDAFGYPDENNVHTMAKNEFPKDMQLESGTIVGFTTPSGEEVPGTINEVKDDEVVIDFNHPLAGFEVVFDVEIIKIKPGLNGNNPSSEII